MLLLAAAIGVDGKPSGSEILAGADARIQRYRTREVVVKLLDEKGQPLAWNDVDPPWLPDDPKVNLKRHRGER